MTAADRIRARRDECAAVVDLLRREGRADSARLVETRMQAWADALAEARAAAAAAELAAMVAAPEPPPQPQWITVRRDADGRLVPIDMPAPAPLEPFATQAAAAEAPAPKAPPAEEPPAPEAAPPAAAGHQVLKIWSAERVALLRDLYTQPDLTLDDIRDRLNELPGPPVTSGNAVKVRGWKLGLLRPALPAAPLADAAPGDTTRAQPARRHGKTPQVWTAERVDALRTMYAAGAKRWTILAHINALPGPPCASVDALKMHAKKLGLTRPGADTPASVPATPPEAAPPAAIPPAAATPAAAQPARDEADPLTWHPAEDIAEARQMMRSGKVGAKALSEYFGWSLAEAQAIAAALRDDLEADARSRAA